MRRRDPKVEAIVLLDPDGTPEIHVLIDGRPVDSSDVVIDATAGHDWDDWKQIRDEALNAATPAARQILEGFYDDPPGGEYVEGRDGRPWLDGVHQIGQVAA
ncbi:hypothetical protein [Rhodococcoides fascians]|uniref:hypothetical protein n=1 Tax=Rhodococcoides fascians TaxID=1828 RepID=UPI00050CF38B|nr:hypothetical protein [Rhodococcus fascians]